MIVQNPPMSMRQKQLIFPITALLFLGFFISGLISGTQWWIDGIMSLGLLVIVMLLNRWLRVGITGYLLIVGGLIVHNIGAYGAYSLTWGIFGYDNLVHVISAAVAAYVAFNFVARRLHIKKHRTVKRTVVDDHLTLLVVLVFALVAMLGTGIELLEFGGAVFLGEGDGILFAGSGDDEAFLGGDSNYADTMTDIIANFVGSILGATAYLLFTYERKPWTKT